MIQTKKIDKIFFILSIAFLFATPALAVRYVPDSAPLPTQAPLQPLPTNTAPSYNTNIQASSSAQAENPKDQKSQNSQQQKQQAQSIANNFSVSSHTGLKIFFGALLVVL